METAEIDEKACTDDDDVEEDGDVDEIEGATICAVDLPSRII